MRVESFIERRIIGHLKRHADGDRPPLHVLFEDIHRLGEEDLAVLEVHFDWTARDGVWALTPRSNLYKVEEAVPTAVSMIWYRAYRCRFCTTLFEHWFYLELPLDVRFKFRIRRPSRNAQAAIPSVSPERRGLPDRFPSLPDGGPLHLSAAREGGRT